MTTTVNYPAVVNRPHYQLMIWHDDCAEAPSGLLHPERAAVEAELAQWRRTWRCPRDNNRVQAQILTFQPVFLLRCADCADIPRQELEGFVEWWILQDAVALHPGWMTTSDQNVFCPYHRPSGPL